MGTLLSFIQTDEFYPLSILSGVIPLHIDCCIVDATEILRYLCKLFNNHNSKVKILQTSIALGLLLCLYSCSKDKIEPYNPTEWKFDKYSDSGILPGDDFYRFVCGKGIASKGSDSWAPFSRWGQQDADFALQALSDEKSNPVPVINRLNELKEKAPEHIAEAFAGMRERLDGIKERTKDMDFPEKAAEYYKNGYSLFMVTPLLLYGHTFGINCTAVYMGILQDCTNEQLKSAISS